MTTAGLNRRSAQLELLAAACARRGLARLEARLPQGVTGSAGTRFLRLADGALHLHWPGQKLAAGLTPGATVRVDFSHAGQRYAFDTRVRGRAPAAPPAQGRASALKLDLPLRLERREQRRSFRYSLRDCDPPVEARLTSVSDPQVSFTLRVLNVSFGGLGGLSVDRSAAGARAGELFWTRLALPDDAASSDFVVRLMHARSSGRPGNRHTRLGCVFCPGDDPLICQQNLRRLERMLIRRRQAVWRRAARPAKPR